MPKVLGKPQWKHSRVISTCSVAVHREKSLPSGTVVPRTSSTGSLSHQLPDASKKISSLEEPKRHSYFMTAPKSMRTHNGNKEGDLTLYMPSAFREASTPLLFCKPNPCLRLARPAGTEQETASEKRNDEAGSSSLSELFMNVIIVAFLGSTQEKHSQALLKAEGTSRAEGKRNSEHCSASNWKSEEEAQFQQGGYSTLCNSISF
ncbi:uncharacterized protein LOC128150540 isoform X2 [Harpia harpyja]|uniref:uncharacterized protein LOC128150540 isoform X1 n=1 Tax=Harpia harpyja TaxID=202280 RepID=UPI0022B206C7|nr:uncharacterized protein LOC128150540 isoform X1 [Harpia harpyja]XP_052662763.1 uncharacterized protein LOC128150540 isoform X2 [Harpia harpyja]